jgi:carotenoid cleavage dioxygenase-like enzyme
MSSIVTATTPGTESPSAEVRRRWWVNAWRPADPGPTYEITRIEGEIPREIHGTFFRNGPSQKVLPEAGFEALHLFDGDGLVHAFRFEDGRVWYRGRFVEDPTFRIEQEEGRFCLSSVGIGVENPTDRLPVRQQHNTNVVWHAGKLWALVENAPPFELDSATLGPRGDDTLGGRLLGTATTAHPKIDGRSGELVIHGYQPFAPYAQFYVVAPDGTCKVAEHVDAPFPGMMHDLALTEHYAIFFLPPVVIDADLITRPGRPFGEAFLWKPELGFWLGVRGREAGAETKWLRVPTEGFVFHAGNAYEDGDRIVVDACTYLDGAALLRSLETFRRGDLVRNWFARPFLYEIDLARGRVAERQLDERGCEFPRLDDRRVGYRNRFGYAVRNRGHGSGPGDSWATIVRYDHEGGRSAEHDFSVGRWASEPVFVARARDAEEGDGFVATVVYDGPNDASDLVILDAANVDAEPLAVAHLEYRIPMGFHGNFVPGLV